MLKVSTLTAVGSSRMLALRPGTLSRILSGIQRAAQTVDVDVYRGCTGAGYVPLCQLLK